MSAPHHYVDPPDVPEGMTLSAWRATRAPRTQGSRAKAIERWRNRKGASDVVALTARRSSPPARAA